MRVFSWYKIINKAEFIATGLVSMKLSVNLLGVGQKDILITAGEKFGMTFEDTFLYLGVNGANPTVFGKYAILENEAGNIYLGIEDED